MLSSMNKFAYILIFVAALFLVSCKSTSKVQDGQTAYILKKYSLASEMLQKDYDKSKDITEQSKIALKIVL